MKCSGRVKHNPDTLNTHTVCLCDLWALPSRACFYFFNGPPCSGGGGGAGRSEMKVKRKRFFCSLTREYMKHVRMSSFSSPLMGEVDGGSSARWRLLL